MIPGWVEPACYLLVGLYLVCALRAAETRGIRGRRYLLLALAGFLGEASCIHLYGFYAYSEGWRLTLDVVPLAVVLVWPVVILSALDLARELVPQRGVRGVAALCGLIVLADAALIEPVAVCSGLWSWSEPGLFAVPPIGVLGWAFFTLAAAAWFEWLDRSGASPWVVRRVEFAILLFGPLAVHLALLSTWWGALRWVNLPIPEWAGVATAWVGSLGVTVWALRSGAVAARGTVLARFPGALLFFVLLARWGQPALVAYVLAFPLPYLVLSWRARGRPSGDAASLNAEAAG